MPRGIQKKYGPIGAMPNPVLSNTEGAEGGGETPPSTPPAGTEPPAEGGQGADHGPKGGPDALKADLARERDQRQALAAEVANLKQAQAAQLDALAKALGIKPDEVPNETGQLAEQLDALRAEIEASKREALVQRVANTHKIPEKYTKYLTETDPAALEEQAKEIAELVAQAAAPGETMPPLAGGARQTPKQPAGSLGDAIAQRYATK